VGACTVACSAAAPSAAAPDDAPLTSARPPGVWLERMTELPAPASEAATTGRIAVLAASDAVPSALATVERFFEAVRSGEPEQLDQIVQNDASVVSPVTGGRQRVRALYRSRLARGKRDGLLEQFSARHRAIEAFRGDAARALGRWPMLATELTAADVVVRVPMSHDVSDPARLFGDEIVFVVRPSAAGYVIVEMIEDYRAF
jgi:hypothetical protein